MTYDQWTKEVEERSKKVKDARKECTDRESEFNTFLKETVGVDLNQQVNLHSVALLVSKIVDMKNA